MPKLRVGRSDLKVNWRSYYQAGEIDNFELSLVRMVERQLDECSTAMIRRYFKIRARLGLLDGTSPHIQHIPRQPPVPKTDEAYTALMEVIDVHDREDHLKFKLCFQLMKYKKDFRARWNELLGFELFSIKEESHAASVLPRGANEDQERGKGGGEGRV